MQVCFEIVGYLLEELRDRNNFEAFKADVANANVFIGSLIFIEELADKVRGGWGPVHIGIRADKVGGPGGALVRRAKASVRCWRSWRRQLNMPVGGSG